MGNLSDKPWLVPGHMYQYDIGWLVDKILSFETELNTAIDLKTIHYADPIQWDITTQYAPNTVVVDPKTGTAYMSKVPIPSGILLTNTDYWVVIFNYQRIYDKIMSGVAFNDKDNLNASKDLLVNDLVWYGGDLYRCTRAIPEGTTYIPGTNLTPTTIADCLATYYGRDRVAQVLNDTLNVSGDYTINAGDISRTASHITDHATIDYLVDADGNYTADVEGNYTADVEGNYMADVEGNYTANVKGKYTGTIFGNREIDVDGDDSVHVDGVTSINRGGAVTEVFGSSESKTVTGASTKIYKDTVTMTLEGKAIVNGKDIEVMSNHVKISQGNNTNIDLTSLYALNMLLYGCDNTGQTSCVDNIAAAVSAGNINLFFPTGTYLIDKPLSLPGNITMIGCGAVLKLTANGSVTLAAGENGYISHFVFDGNSVASTGLIIDTDAAGVVVESCYFSNFTIASVKIGNTLASGGHQWLVNCKIYNPDTMATCLDVLHPDVKLVGCELYYTKRAINLRASILFLDTCHIWSGGDKANAINDDFAIYCNKYAELNIVNTYIDSFLTGIAGAYNIVIQGDNLYFYWDASRSYTKNYVIGILLSTWSKYNISYIANKSANVDIYPVSFVDYNDFIDAQPETFLKTEYTPDNAHIATLSTATAATFNKKRTVLFKSQVVTPNTWYHCGWIVPSSNDWLNFKISDGKNNCNIDMYFDKNRTSTNLDTSRNTIASESWDFGIGAKETVTIAGQDIVAYPIFIRSILANIGYSLFMFNNTSSWISVFNGVNNKSFNGIYTLIHS